MATTQGKQISGYRISEQLYEGSRTIVYRGIRENDEKPVVIKLLKNLYPSFGELVQFRNQYTIAKNIKTNGIIQTYSLETYQNGYMLVMEDIGAISLEQYFTNIETPYNALQKGFASTSLYTAFLQEFLQIAISLCDTLDVLCRHRVIHKDIKPANILINPETKQIKLIDFSIASLLPKETQILMSPNLLEGTLSYISPEQTGRMNRGIDYRTDFYSLGITFYELLAGELPFKSKDTMELVHCHIAKTSVSLDTEKKIPSTLSNIVKKLMAKNAEDRYQSALGLKYDLEKCLYQLKEVGKIEDFKIAQKDICDRFIIPEKLYGREIEVEQLLAAFDRISGFDAGKAELMLVAGFSGIGKTALVNEVHKPIVKQRGYFIKGKFDQFNRNIPFSALVEAFRNFMGQLLTETDAQLSKWKIKILEALGENGQVIIEVIPELEKIIGKQPLTKELVGNAAQNRFNLLFQKFLQVFTTKEHPLVIFLDDLQWADSASLNLIQLLISKSESGHLLIIGAYRDNEVFPAHPLMLMLDEVKKTGSIINTVFLKTLNKDSLTQLVADTLTSSTHLSQPLTDIIYQTTQGNPFFATQFLKTLYQDGLIYFDFQARYWQCDITRVREASLTDDVVKLMATQLQKLPAHTRDILKLAACIGNQFDLATLAIVSENSEADTADILWKALQEGLILPQTEVYKFYIGDENTEVNADNAENTNNVTYRFLHDRVQQAAYSLIPDAQKQEKHLEIGYLILSSISKSNLEERIFEIVNHLNRGVKQITDLKDKEKLLDLNITAGYKAKISTAYKSATEYFDIAISLLNHDCWQSQYELTLKLYIQLAEIEYLAGNYQHSEAISEIVEKNAVSVIDKAKIYELKIQILIARNQYIEAINHGIEIVTLFDIKLQQVGDFKEPIKLPQISELDRFPEMTEPRELAAMRVLAAIIPAAFMAQPEVWVQIVLTMVDLSINRGHCFESAYTYIQYGELLAVIQENIEAGYASCQLGIELLNRQEQNPHSCKIHFVYNFFIRHLKEPAEASVLALQTSIQEGLDIGDIEYATYCACFISPVNLFRGDLLESLNEQQQKYLELAQRFQQGLSIDTLKAFKQISLNLLGESDSPPSQLHGAYFKEVEDTSRLEAIKSNLLLHLVYAGKTMLSYLLGETSDAITHARQSEEYVGGMTLALASISQKLYCSLALLAEFPHSAQQQELLKQVKDNQSQMANWAHHAPMNFQHKYDLVEAEKCKVLGQKTEAIELYEQAISAAEKNGYIHEVALAKELTAKFYLDWGKDKVAQVYMQEAYYCYMRWGARAKTDDLEKRYAQLITPILEGQQYNFNINETNIKFNQTLQTTCSHSSASASEALDFASILKATQALSSEIQLEQLISTLMQIVIENAGASKAALIFRKDDMLSLEAVATKDNGVTHLSIPYDEYADIPNTVINYVKRSLQNVVLDNATVQNKFISDEYLIKQQPYSLLCAPILDRGKLTGLLYLENKLIKGAFTKERLEVINLLCTQAAISLENARLHAQEREKSYRLEQSQKRLKLVIEQTPVAVIEWNTKFEFQSWNPAAEKIFGYREDEILGQHFSRIVPEDYRIYVDDIATQILSQDGGMHAINENLTKDGHRIICEWFNSPILNSNGEVYGGVSMTLDITDRKKAEAVIMQKSQELETALQELQTAQLQMVQNEKMATLGNLVAGVAHEVNNPIGFLKGSISNAHEYIKDLFKHIECYQENYPNPEEEVIENAEDIDLEFISKDLPKLLTSMEVATERITDISNSLRTFSRADTSQKVACNVHEGIDSTILILKYRLKANDKRPAIEIIKEYGKLPPIKCFLGQLNQVFMNIIANAIDALDITNEGKTFAEIEANPHKITISTEASRNSNSCLIRLQDNGPGMPETVKERIFDNLFTTKEVGKGTGLGLAIAKKIVEETHSGKLICNSTLGEGTEFVIELPIES